MSRNHNDKKSAPGSNNRNRKAMRYSPRYRSSNNQNGHVTEDERLLRRPTQPLISPTDPVPQEQVKQEQHALERALHLDFT
ncbi:MAG: TIGR00730 family Rossman fold protein, partial [Ktedonobacteraceae bacterium]|nr:TIGR00730 family Rossman fold protein [Ktedonobacteraceae bacterium]